MVAVLNDDGQIEEQKKFPTPEKYDDFIVRLANTVDSFTTKKFEYTGVAVPGKVDREKGIAIAFGNLKWANIPIKSDVEKIVNCSVVIENDANLAGLSEAMLLLDEYERVLYLTISTGIGDGIIIKGIIDPDLADSEPGQMMIEHEGKIQKWESFASGRAILKRFGQQAKDISDPSIWRKIASDMAVGMLDLIAVIQPQVIIIGGSVGNYFDKYKIFLEEELKKFENPLVPIPPIREAARPNEAVIFGCYYLAKDLHGKTSS